MLHKNCTNSFCAVFVQSFFSSVITFFVLLQPEITVQKKCLKKQTEMNKANALLIAAVLTATSLAQAKDYHLVVKPSTGKASAFWGNTEVFVDGSAQRDTITMLKDGKNWRVRSKFLASNAVY